MNDFEWMDVEICWKSQFPRHHFGQIYLHSVIALLTKSWVVLRTFELLMQIGSNWCQLPSDWANLNISYIEEIPLHNRRNTLAQCQDVWHCKGKVEGKVMQLWQKLDHIDVKLSSVRELTLTLLHQQKFEPHVRLFLLSFASLCSVATRLWLNWSLVRVQA